MFDHSSVTLDGVHNASSNLTLGTTGHGMLVPVAPQRTMPLLPLLAASLLAIAAFLAARFSRASKRLRLASSWLAVLVLVACALAACNSSGNGGGAATPAGSYTVTVTLAAGADSHPIPVTLNVTR